VTFVTDVNSASPACLQSNYMGDLNVVTSELIAAANWDALAQRLCSLAYVQEKAEAGRVFDLIAEYDAVVAVLPSGHPASAVLPVLAESLRRNATFISRHPVTAFQCFWNSCVWLDCAQLGDFNAAFVGTPPVSIEQAKTDGPVSLLMESWRSERASNSNESPWLRSLIPPIRPISGQLLLELPLYSEGELPRALSLSGEYLAAWFCNRSESKRKRAQLRVWNSQTGEPIRDIPNRRFPFPDPSLSSDKKLKVSFGGEDGGWGHPVRVSDVQTGDSVAVFPTDEDHNIDCVAFSADGALVAAGAGGLDFEGYVYIWDLQSKSLRMLLEPRSSVNSVAFAPSGDEILIGSSGGDLEIWGLSKAAIRNSIFAHDSWVIAATFSSDGKRIASISYDGTLRVWDLAARQSTTQFAPHPDDIAEAKFSPDGHRLVTRSANGTTWLWEGNTGKPIKRLHQSASIVQMGGNARNSLFVGNHMIVSMGNGGGVWKSSDGHLLSEVAERVYSHQLVCFTPDGKRFALWGGWPDETCPITIHDIRTGARSDMPVEMEAMNDNSPSEDGHFIMTMSEDGEIRTHRVPDRIELGRIDAHAGGTTSCAFSTDSALLVSGGADAMVKVWDWDTGVELFSADVNAVAPLRRGRKARSANADRARICEVKFVDDHTIAAAIEEEQVIVWNFRNGEHVGTVVWAGTFAEFPQQMRYRAEHRQDEVVIVDSETAAEVAWLPCGRSLGSRLILVPHPNGRAWAGMHERRLYHFVLE